MGDALDFPMGLVFRIFLGRMWRGHDLTRWHLVNCRKRMSKDGGLHVTWMMDEYWLAFLRFSCFIQRAFVQRGISSRGFWALGNWNTHSHTRIEAQINVSSNISRYWNTRKIIGKKFLESSLDFEFEYFVRSSFLRRAHWGEPLWKSTVWYTCNSKILWQKWPICYTDRFWNLS